MPFLATILFAIACADASPSATIAIQTPTHVEHGTILTPCKPTLDGYVNMMEGPAVHARDVPNIGPTEKQCREGLKDERCGNG